MFSLHLTNSISLFTYETVYRLHVEPTFAHLHVLKIQPSRIQAWVKEFVRAAGPLHVHYRISRLERILDLALVAAHPGGLRAIPELAASLAMREGEQFGLAEEDLDLTAGDQYQADGAGYFRSCLATTMRWIRLVPS